MKNFYLQFCSVFGVEEIALDVEMEPFLSLLEFEKS